MYPVPFRYLDGDRQFRKYDVITVRTRDAGSDKRPESRKIDAPSIKIGSHLDGWRARAEWVENLTGTTMCQLLNTTKVDVNGPSLGAVRPASISTITFEQHLGWTAEQISRFAQYKSQGDLFQDVPPRLLDPPRLIVHLAYRCEEWRCLGHRQRIIDLELTALQAKYRGRSDDELKAAIKRNFLEIPFANDRAPMVFVGNQETSRAGRR